VGGWGSYSLKFSSVAASFSSSAAAAADNAAIAGGPSFIRDYNNNDTPNANVNQIECPRKLAAAGLVCLLRVFLSVLTLGTFQLKSSCSSLTPTYLPTYLPTSLSTYLPTYLPTSVCVCFYYF
jgi:hypothetical protein